MAGRLAGGPARGGPVLPRCDWDRRQSGWLISTRRTAQHRWAGFLVIRRLFLSTAPRRSGVGGSHRPVTNSRSMIGSAPRRFTGRKTYAPRPGPCLRRFAAGRNAELSCAPGGLLRIFPLGGSGRACERLRPQGQRQLGASLHIHLGVTALACRGIFSRGDCAITERAFRAPHQVTTTNRPERDAVTGSRGTVAGASTERVARVSSSRSIWGVRVSRSSGGVTSVEVSVAMHDRGGAGRCDWPKRSVRVPEHHWLAGVPCPVLRRAV